MDLSEIISRFEQWKGRPFTTEERSCLGKLTEEDRVNLSKIAEESCSDFVAAIEQKVVLMISGQSGVVLAPLKPPSVTTPSPSMATLSPSVTTPFPSGTIPSPSVTTPSPLTKSPPPKPREVRPRSVKSPRSAKPPCASPEKVRQKGAGKPGQFLEVTHTPPHTRPTPGISTPQSAGSVGSVGPSPSPSPAPEKKGLIRRSPQPKPVGDVHSAPTASVGAQGKTVTPGIITTQTNRNLTSSFHQVHDTPSGVVRKSDSRTKGPTSGFGIGQRDLSKLPYYGVMPSYSDSYPKELYSSFSTKKGVRFSGLSAAKAQVSSCRNATPIPPNPAEPTSTTTTV